MWFRRKFRVHEIEPDEIFLDSSNLPKLDADRLEGRVERPIAPLAVYAVAIVFGVATTAFAAQAFNLQVLQGDKYADISRNNRLERSVIFAARGIITDRNGKELAWNELETNPAATSTTLYPLRAYITSPGFSHLLGFVRYPKADESGAWWREEYTGVAGIESAYNSLLAGTNGSSMAETDARGVMVREDIVDPPRDGEALALSIDADVQAKLAQILSDHAQTYRFQGGAAAIMNVENGELLALVSFPEYDAQAFAEGNRDVIAAANVDTRKPLLNRAVSGLYAPGSIVKPYVAAAALAENIINPEKAIFSAGSISIPNPYFPDKPSIFKDWKAHGWVDMRRAIAVSSDVYFYAIGGGFEDQRGLGIAKIDEWAKKFGFTSETGIIFGGEPKGTIPTPEWKKEVFDDDWRLGDTYNTAIGQYGFQVTPLQVIRYVVGLASGKLFTPQLVKDAQPQFKPIDISKEHLKIVREGMRAAVTDGGTASALNIPGLEIAGKTGTAQVGVRNEFMNSWVIGFWPASKPKYAFAVVLEKAPAGTLSGASPAMSPFFYWLKDNKREYIK